MSQNAQFLTSETRFLESLMYISIAVSYSRYNDFIRENSITSSSQPGKNSIVHYCIIVFIMGTTPYLLTIFIGDEMTKNSPDEIYHYTVLF